MTKIISSPNCGNSPKMKFIEEFNIAFAKGNLEFLIESVSDEIIWNIIGDKKIEGKEHFAEELKKMKSEKVSELILHQILSHGKEYAFSDLYKFHSAKGENVKEITSYLIEIQVG